MKILLWVYATVGVLYLGMYALGIEPVVKYAVGPLWIMMVASPVLLVFLILAPIFMGKRR